MFDNDRERKERRKSGPEASRPSREDARIALRCPLAELQLVDSFVTSGEFGTRSELLRAALHAFLRSKAMSSTPTPPVDAEGYVETAVRLTQEEYAAVEAYSRHMANRADVRDTLALIFRYGEEHLGIREHARRVRELNREAVETRTRVGELSESGRDLERKGVVGR